MKDRRHVFSKRGDMLFTITIFRSDPIFRMYSTVVWTISNMSYIPKYWVTLRCHGSYRLFWKYMAMDAYIIDIYVMMGCAPSFHSCVYVAGHFKNLVAGAFLPPPRSPAKSMREPRFPPPLSHWNDKATPPISFNGGSTPRHQHCRNKLD